MTTTQVDAIDAKSSDRADMDVERISRAWRAFMAYRGLSLQVFDTQALSYAHLPDAHQSLLPMLPVRLSHAAEAAEHNADLLQQIAALTGIGDAFVPEDTPHEMLEQTVADFPDVVDALLAVVRDWSSHGEKDRAKMYDPIVAAVQEAADDALSAHVVEHAAAFSVLVIGASLGRLAWELAGLGLSVQGVESSYLQLFTCNYIINGSATPDRPMHLYPFVHHTGLVSSADDQLREVYFPDANPKALEETDLSMVAGEFLELYDDEAAWDCVVTCFSIENTHSVISYVRRIAKLLKPGAVWVNHGSLDFRYDDSESEPSIEITEEELYNVIARSGLRVIRRENLRCRPPYTVTGMVSEEFITTFTVAVKV